MKIGTRASRLAVLQARQVADFLAGRGVPGELVTMTTTGDRILDRPLDTMGGKGLFVKELDRALLEGRTDLSVHSLKDLPMEVPEELPLVGFSPREDPRDVLVLPAGASSWDKGLPVGCGSRRRSVQLLDLEPGLTPAPIRGNVLTRLEKLDRGEYGALVLAAAGLKRLGLEGRIFRYFSVEEMIPAAGQGILALQGRRDFDRSLLTGFHDAQSQIRALAERAFVRTLGGGCSAPVGAYAHIEKGRLHLAGMFWDGRECRRVGGSGALEKPEELGQALAREARHGA